MSDENLVNQDIGQVGNLTDFVSGATKDNPLHIEVAVNDNGKIVVFHDKPFSKPVSWFEFDMGNCRLNFIMEEGEQRDAGLALLPAITKHMQNAHQILTVLMNDQTGEASEGLYIPLILHQG
jgi:hypothetical protein